MVGQAFLRSISGTPGQYAELVTSQGATIPAIFTNPLPPGVYDVADFGAVALPTGSDQDQAAVALRTANTAAFNAAVAFIVAAGGGTLLVGPGIWLTNGPWGLNSTLDLNVNLTVQGVSGFTLIRSNNYTLPCVWFHTTGGNLRQITLIDLTIRGGREGLSLTWVAYSNFVRCWFWGSKQWAVQNEAGSNNVWIAPKFNESAQGIGDGTYADAMLFVSCEDTVIAPQYGEFCGGVIFNGGVCNLDDPLFHDCEYRGQNYFSYIDGVPVVIAPTFLPITASIILWQGSLIASGINGNYLKRFLTAFRAYDLVLNGRLQTLSSVAPDFVGFIDVETGGGTVLALNVQALTAVFLGGNSGYLIKDSDNALHDAMVHAQVELYDGSYMTPLSTSAPALLNPNFQGNQVELAVFNRFVPRDVPEVTAVLDLTLGTNVSGKYSAWPDTVINNPAVQTTAARRPVAGIANAYPIATFADADSTSMAWALNAGNNQTTKTGYCGWAKQPASGGPERLISIGGGVGGASGQKLFLALDSSERFTVGLYSSDTGGRQAITAPAAFAADTYFFWRWAYDSSLGTEALRCKLYINEIPVALTFSDIGTGGVPTVLRTVTGNAILGNFQNDPSSVQGLNGSMGATVCAIAGDVSAANGVALMNFRRPVAA